MAVFPALMAAALGLDQHATASAYRLLLDRLLVDSGSPSDPIERMMIEQLVMCHFRAAQLQSQAGSAQGLEAAAMYNAAAARLLAEFRKSAVALQTYREKARGLAKGLDGGVGEGKGRDEKPI